MYGSSSGMHNETLGLPKTEMQEKSFGKAFNGAVLVAGAFSTVLFVSFMLHTVVYGGSIAINPSQIGSSSFIQCYGGGAAKATCKAGDYECTMKLKDDSKGEKTKTKCSDTKNASDAECVLWIAAEEHTKKTPPMTMKINEKGEVQGPEGKDAPTMECSKENHFRHPYEMPKELQNTYPHNAHAGFSCKLKA